MWLYLSYGSRYSDLLFLETYRISLTRSFGILWRTCLLPFTYNNTWRFNSNHKRTQRLPLQGLTLPDTSPPEGQTLSSPREYQSFKARSLAVDLETLDALAGLNENPPSWPFLSWPCPWLDSVPFDELKNIGVFFFTFFPFLLDSLSNQRSACDNKYCYGWKFSQEIIIIITADCLLCSLTFYSRDGQKYTQSKQKCLVVIYWFLWYWRLNRNI